MNFLIYPVIAHSEFLNLSPILPLWRGTCNIIRKWSWSVSQKGKYNRYQWLKKVTEIVTYKEILRWILKDKLTNTELFKIRIFKGGWWRPKYLKTVMILAFVIHCFCLIQGNHSKSTSVFPENVWIYLWCISYATYQTQR